MKKATKRKSKPQARVTAVHVERLFNTGNYTNVKYGISAEVLEGADPGEVLTQLAHTVGLLKPIPVPHCKQQYEEALGKVQDQLTEYEKEHFSEWREEMRKYEEKNIRRESTVKCLIDLGGTSLRKDAKNTWENDDTHW